MGLFRIAFGILNLGGGKGSANMSKNTVKDEAPTSEGTIIQINEQVGGPRAETTDIEAAFRIFLARKPESKWVIESYAGRDLHEVFADICLSDESAIVRNGFDTHGWFSAHRKLGRSALTKLLAWGSQRKDILSHDEDAATVFSWGQLYILALKIALRHKDSEDEVNDILSESERVLEQHAKHASSVFGNNHTDTYPQSTMEAFGIWGNTTDDIDPALIDQFCHQFSLPEHVVLFSEYFFEPCVAFSFATGRTDKRTSLEIFLSSQKQMRQDTQAFDGQKYVQRYPDIAAAGFLPAYHFVAYGHAEGREFQVNLDGPREPNPSWQEIHKRIAPIDKTGRAGGQSTWLGVWLRDLQARILSAGLGNAGWIGDRKISHSERFYANCGIPASDTVPAFNAASSVMEKKFYSEVTVLPTMNVSEKYLEISGKAAGHQSSTFSNFYHGDQTDRGVLNEGCSLVTPFWGHIGFFEQCAASVASMVATTEAKLEGDLNFEWVIANDDPKFTNADLMNRIPVELRKYVNVVKAGGLKTTGATNVALRAATKDWIMFLDCDDLLLPDALLVFHHYTKSVNASYYASAMIDIDDFGRILRFRRHEHSPLQAPNVGMNAGHLKLVRKSLFEEYGLLDERFNSSQDYEFLLRVLDTEKVMLVPEYLYMYRWHDNTQSVSKFFDQEQVANVAKKLYVTKSISANVARKDDFKVGVVIRTRGNRNETLVEAIESCLSLEEGVTVCPIVVVHGDKNRLRHVAHGLDARYISSNKYALVSANKAAKYRGYPLNVGFDYAIKQLKCDGVGILDDDDILLPSYFQMPRLMQEEPCIVFGRSVAKDGDGNIQEMHSPAPQAALLFENFITTNSFIANPAAIKLIKSVDQDIFPEDLHYLEDWYFFMKAHASGVRLQLFDSIVSEFRLGSDGNSAIREKPFEFSRCQERVMQFARKIRTEQGNGLLRGSEHIPQKYYEDLPDHMLANLKALASSRGAK